MKLEILIYGVKDQSKRRSFRILFFSAWVCVVSLLAWNHVVWRDEVRALSIALQGRDIVAMLRGLHGEGHPAIWYLLLRAAHALISRPETLQIASLLVAFTAVLLFILRSPFGLLLVALVLTSRFALFEYSVMARNYGISMLLLFLIATLYERHRERSLVLGGLLFLLANTNVHSVILVIACLVFWFFDIVFGTGGGRPAALRTFFSNAALAAIGIAVCVVTVYPPFNDAAQIGRPDSLTFTLLLKSMLLPAASFNELLSFSFSRRILEHPSLQVFISALMFGSTLGLVRRPAALLASSVALIGLSTLFNTVYAGFYRHQALWLVFLLSMYWIAGRANEKDRRCLSTRAETLVRTIRASGVALFVSLLALQAAYGINKGALTLGITPESRSRDLGALITRSPELREAIVVSDPDFMVESLSYYVPNRTYLMREQRFGNVVVFTRMARLRLSLDDILTDARNLRMETSKPVIILLQERLDPSLPAKTIKEGYNWELVITPEQVRTFLASTRLIERFGPVTNNDESYDVYILS